MQDPAFVTVVKAPALVIVEAGLVTTSVIVASLVEMAVTVLSPLIVMGAPGRETVTAGRRSVETDVTVFKSVETSAETVRKIVET